MWSIHYKDTVMRIITVGKESDIFSQLASDNAVAIQFEDLKHSKESTVDISTPETGPKSKLDFKYY